MLVKKQDKAVKGKTAKTTKVVKKSNITFGTLKGKLKVAKDTWDDDLKQTIQ